MSSKSFSKHCISVICVECGLDLKPKVSLAVSFLLLSFKKKDAFHLIRNCKNRKDCPLDGNCQTSDIIYKYIASTTVNPDKIYLGTAEGNFKKRYYNHKTSFKNRGKANGTTLLKYVWKVKNKYKETPSLK